MPIQNVTTTSKQHISPHGANSLSVDIPFSNNNEIDKFSAFFELLSQIDKRLKNEDPDYKGKHYTDSALERKNQ